MALAGLGNTAWRTSTRCALGEFEPNPGLQLAAIDPLRTSLVSAACLAHFFPSSTAHDRPVHIVILALTACSFALPSASKALPNLFQPPGGKKGLYTALPLEELGQANRGGVDHLNASSEQPQQGDRVRISILAAAICALSVRIELYRRISKATECTIDSVEMFLPLLLALYDAVRSQRTLNLPPDERPDNTIYESLRAAVTTHILRPRTRYLLSILMVSYGCYLAQGLWMSSTSTYICPIVVGEPKTIPMMQICALFLDFCLAIIAYETSPKNDGRGLSGRRYVVLWSSVMIATSVVWAMVALIVYVFKPEYRVWLLFLFPPLGFDSLIAIVGHVLLFCVLCISTLHCVSPIWG